MEAFLLVTRNTGNYDEYHLEWLKNTCQCGAFSQFRNGGVRQEMLLCKALRDVACAQDGT